ncbi:MAG: bifunctional glyoxylate/hydroxypyruvate reductase A [Gammaproteobacteria bacterium]|nr:MAG: bifunctional glyoxylate/hydroxypyruvate reductase A [Gammaproteobacteria bacterium]
MKTLAIYHSDRHYVYQLLMQFQARLPSHNVVAWRENVAADYLLSWHPDPKIFSTQNVKVIFALGAGVDAFLAADIPESIPLVRLEEAGMGDQMLEMALYGVLHYSRDMVTLNRAQRQKQWLPLSTPKKLPFSTRVGVMGLGQLGRHVAVNLANIGYSVSGYSRTLKSLDNVACYDDEHFDAFLHHSEVLINLLPLTAETEGCLNTTLFERLPKGAFLINIARGRHLMEEDLLNALNSGQLSGALLDVFRTEPLPKIHPFWSDDRIIVTPHLAAITLPNHAVDQISHNILAFEASRPMTGVIDRKRGY